MLSRLYRCGLFFLFAVGIIACTTRPSGVMSQKKMAKVQEDMQIAEALINNNSNDYMDSTQRKSAYGLLKNASRRMGPSPIPARRECFATDGK